MLHCVAPSLSSLSLRSVQCHTVREFAAAPHLFSGCCLPVCFVLSSCVFKRWFLLARDTWKEPWHERKTSPQRRGGGGGWNDNTRKETRPRNKLRLNHKTIKLQRWEEEKRTKCRLRHTQQWEQIKRANKKCCMFMKRPWQGQITPTASSGCLASNGGRRVLLEMKAAFWTKWLHWLSACVMESWISEGSRDFMLNIKNKYHTSTLEVSLKAMWINIKYNTHLRFCYFGNDTTHPLPPDAEVF